MSAGASGRLPVWGFLIANEGAGPVGRAVSFVTRIAVSLVLPVWGAFMIRIGAGYGQGWRIATGAVMFAIGVIFFAGSSIITPFLPGSRPSPDHSRGAAGAGQGPEWRNCPFAATQLS